MGAAPDPGSRASHPAPCLHGNRDRWREMKQMAQAVLLETMKPEFQNAVFNF